MLAFSWRVLVAKPGKRRTYSYTAGNASAAGKLLGVDGIGGSKAKGDDLNDGDLHLEGW